MTKIISRNEPSFSRIEERRDIKISVDGIDKCLITSVNFNEASWSSTSDYTVYFEKPEDELSIKRIMELMDTEDSKELPFVHLSIDNQPFLKHRIKNISKSRLFGERTYSFRGESELVLLDAMGSIDFNTEPYINVWNAHEAIKIVFEKANVGLKPSFFFADFEILHIMNFVRIPFKSMVEDILSGVSIYVYCLPDGEVIFTDPLHRSRSNLQFDNTKNINADISYISPAERDWG